MEKLADFIGSKKGFRRILQFTGFAGLVAGMFNPGLVIIALACLTISTALNDNE